MADAPPRPALPAATATLVRDADGPEVPVVRRRGQIGFAADALVFEPQDL